MSSELTTNNRPKLTVVIPKPRPSKYSPVRELFPGPEPARYYDTLIQAREDFNRIEVVRMAKQADAVMILDEWKAAREKEQELIARIKREAGPRDEIRLARLEEEKRQKEEAEAELAYRRKEMRKALRKDRREMEKMEKIFRKDMRERNGVHKNSSPSVFADPVRRSARLAARQSAVRKLAAKME
ncbi:MAG: hypothetical protein HETSPECPRED_009220 [Heterodermia speciosa]|uniref:Uncharacterized protein n=1 Tax=Heterodermia speciosa TaxID=116794 RepID=A0A8H3G7C3_9LECA|nr:MAG: hypothetical protein HETSPECPRED_009220 [Heterodermia speciosa]